ncbi:hypothetical protein [Levilactobacillus zymae]|nr:hypothetical protein [Levilactobacillus zymae]MDT6979356.1 hypothetical protein [Levilactobacillus zymae]
MKLRQAVADELLSDLPVEQHDDLVAQIRQLALRAVANEHPESTE